MIYFSSWGRPHIVINSHDAAVELLEKRSTLYSDRPRMPMINELCVSGFPYVPSH